MTTTFSPYDGMNRVTGKSYNDGITPAVGYAYYPPCFGGCATLSQGRLMSVISGALVNEYLDYDTMGRVTKSRQITAGVTYPFAYHYDQSGALASVKYPSGRVVTNTFDGAGRVSQVSGPSNYASQVKYAPQGAIQSLSLGNGIAETWAFNTRQQPTSLQFSTLLSLTWGYGTDSSNNGNVMSHSITRGPATATLNQYYSYVDPSNRLSSALESAGWPQTYSYDAFGNRAVASGSYAPNPDQTPAALTEFTLNRWKRGNGDSYDGSGNQTAVATRANPGTSVNFFTYDGENRMVTSNVASMGTVTYSYDGEGRRVQKSWSCSAGNGTCSTVFVYDAMGQLAAEYATAPNTASGTEYLTADSLGSTRLVTDASGAVTQCYDYLPFGEEIPQGINGRGSCYPQSAVYPHTADATSRKFTGKERDVETGLDYFGFRYLSSPQGRWTGPDQPLTDQQPGDPQSWNMYAYVRNNPLKNIDPNGKQSCAMNPDMCQSVLHTGRPTGKDAAIAAAMFFGPAAIAVAPEFSLGALVRGLITSAVGYSLTPQGQQTLTDVGMATLEGISGVPLGIGGPAGFRQFTSTLAGGLEEAGAEGAKAFITGSAVTGKSFKTGLAFDAGRVSDVDIAVVSKSLLGKAKELGLQLRSAGGRTAVLEEEALKALGLDKLQRSLSMQAGRPVTFMIYESEEVLKKRGNPYTPLQ